MASSTSTSSSILAKQKDECFMDLMEECRLARPGSNFSYYLRMRLEKFPVETRKEIASRLRDGCAPLFVACRKGQLEMVEYLIYACQVDVDMNGVYEVPDEGSVHHVTPLWCASVSGKLSIVHFLVTHGADLNAVSDTGSTPVRSACFMSHFDVVKYLVENGANINLANYNGGTCLINSVQSVRLCKFLLENGADVNARDIQRKTALHYAIQEHRLGTAILLIEWGADYLAQSRHGDDALQTACVKGAANIFEYLRDNLDYSDERIANAHELLGATCLDELSDVSGAIQHWRVAMSIRETEGLLPKAPVMPVRVAFGRQKEFQSVGELENVITDVDAIRIQSLLVIERILGPSHRDTIFRLIVRGATCIDLHQYQRGIDLWRYALEIRVEKETILHTDACYTAQTLVKVMIDYNEIIRSSATMEPALEKRFEDALAIYNLLSHNISQMHQMVLIRPSSNVQVQSYETTLVCICHLLYVMLQTAKTEEQMLLVRQSVRNLVRANLKTIALEDTLLHLAVSGLTTLRGSYLLISTTSAIFPSPEVAQVLLDCGANINSRNKLQSTPLHLATSNNNNVQLVKLLLEYGAHIDQPDGLGVRPIDKLKAAASASDLNLLQFLKLKCLCAVVISNYRIPYEDQVPKTLETFIKLHQIKETR